MLILFQMLISGLPGIWILTTTKMVKWLMLLNQSPNVLLQRVILFLLLQNITTENGIGNKRKKKLLLVSEVDQR